jgi:hypothetical protein
MPRFYFDTFNGSLWVGDPEGIECPDVEAAMELAKVAMSDMAHDELPGGEGLTIMVRIRDQAGQTVAETELDIRSQYVRRRSGS